jgi:N-acetylmuramoyl-L-alanine amidase
MHLISKATAFFISLTIGIPSAYAKTCEPGTFTVVIDPGHGPERSGATSSRGEKEVTFNLRLANELLIAVREKGYVTAELTHDGQIDLTLSQRAAISKGLNADLFLSLHHDSVQEHFLGSWTYEGEINHYADQFKGHSIFVNQALPDAAASLEVATALGQKLLAAGLRPTHHHAEKIAGEGRLLIEPALGIYRFDALGVLKRAEYPAVLFEAGVLVNRAEESQLNQPEYRAILVDALVHGIDTACLQASNR